MKTIPREMLPKGTRLRADCPFVHTDCRRCDRPCRDEMRPVVMPQADEGTAPAPAEASTHLCHDDAETPHVRTALFIGAAFFIDCVRRWMPRWAWGVLLACLALLALIGAGALYGFMTR